MPLRKANAHWEGTLFEGKGKMQTESGKFESEFTAGARFKEEPGTNPEELLGAAYAGCFSMALANILDQAGFTPKRIQTSAKVRLDKVDDGFKIKSIELDTEADVPDIDEGEFKKHAEKAKDTCPVSQALTGVEKSVTSRLK